MDLPVGRVPVSWVKAFSHVLFPSLDMKFFMLFLVFICMIDYVIMNFSCEIPVCKKTDEVLTKLV